MLKMRLDDLYLQLEDYIANDYPKQCALVVCSSLLELHRCFLDGFPGKEIAEINLIWSSILVSPWKDFRCELVL